MIEEKPIRWQELLEAVFRRRRVILAGALAGLLAAAALVWLTPPVYEAKTRILLTDQPVPGPRQEAMAEKQIQAELAFIKSPALIRGVLEAHQEADEEAAESDPPPASGPLRRLQKSVTHFFQNLYSRLHDVPPPSALDRRVEAIAERITAGSIERSNVVEVAFASGDPEWSAAFVNNLIAHHIDRIAQLNEQTGSLPVFQKQRELLEERWRSARQALADFRQENETSLLLVDEQEMRRVLGQLRSQQVAAETQVLELQAKVDFLASELELEASTITAESRVSENESVSQLKSRILELEMERSEMISKYTETSKLIKDLDRRIEETQRLLATKEEKTLTEEMTAVNPTYQALKVDMVQTRSELTAAQARVNALGAQIGKYRQDLRRMELTSTELERLQNELGRADTAYQAFLQQDDDATLSSTLDESGIVNVSVLEPAEVPLNPEPSSHLTTLLGGLLAGLAGGLGLAFLRDALDPTVKSTAQAARLSGAPVLAEIPAD